MNVNDVQSVQIQGDRLIAMFDRQLELMDKYKEIEKMPDWPLNLHSAEHQKILKDFAWRITEELGEAMTVISEEVPDEPTEEQCDQIWSHFTEEVADALHFLIELCRLSGLDPQTFAIPAQGNLTVNGDMLTYVYNLAGFTLQEIQKCHPDINPAECAWIVVNKLADAMNCLKNKPWKQTQIFTDVDQYKERIQMTFSAFLMFCINSSISDDLLTDVYFRKSEVNRFRQRSNY